MERVGLATGDVCIRRGAEVTVMTTEVYRNMAWKARSSSGGGGTVMDGDVGDDDNAASLDETATDRSAEEEYRDLSSNSIVVLDEFHYMGEKGRGSTWEESVIFNPPSTQIVG